MSDAKRTSKKPTPRAVPAGPTLQILAKIDRPRLSDIYARPRLFERLERLCERRLIWLSAPAGSGKTTSVVSWLQSRAGRVLWYQCDEGDADIASFFHFLSRAHVLQTSPLAAPLPTLAPELYGALPAFVRNFFRELCAQLPTPSFIVFDNWQDIPASAPLHELLPVAIGELPRGVVCIILSREEPPVNLSRLHANAEMADLGWAEIKLTLQETEAIIVRQQPAGATLSDAQSLYELTQGWAVGLIAMLRLGSQASMPRVELDQQAVQPVFNYLTSEVLERLSPEVQQFLLQTACLEFITAPVAQALTGREDARPILDSLVHTNTFTLQRPASQSYHYHPLFRELLRSRAAAQWSRAEQEALLTRAAQILERQNDPEMAIELLLRACRWSDAAVMMQRHAPTLTQQGRFKTLADWIDALPAALSSQWPWLTYWQGMARMAIDFPRATASFELAHRRFTDNGDVLGQMLSIAALLQVYLISFSDFRRMRPWIGVLVALLGRRPDFPSPGVELTVWTGLFSAITSAQPDHPRLQDCQTRIIALLHADVDLHSRLSAGAALANHLAVSGDLATWRQLMPQFESTQSAQVLPPPLRIQYLWFEAAHLFKSGDIKRAHALLDEGMKLAEQNALPIFAARLELSKLLSTDCRGRAPEVLATLLRLEPQFRHAPPLLMSFFTYVHAIALHLHADVGAAEREMRLSHELVEQSGYVLAKSWVLLGLGEIYCAAGRLEEADDCVVRCRHITSALPMPIMEFDAGLLRAEIARQRSQWSEAARELRHALSIGRTHGYANGVNASSVILPRIIPYALELGIEADYCRWLIRHHALPPPARDIPGWPWRIRIESLGSFQVHIDDRPLRVSVKTQRRPLNLLKALLVQQHGCEIELLMDRYWPDLDGDAARNAFDLALHRLRKLLQHKDAIVLAQGRVLLNRGVVWVDAFALDILADGDDDSLPPAEQVRRLLQLYRGPLLAHESEPWMFAPRERLRSTFLRSVAQLSDLLQASHQYDALTQLNHRVLELEQLSEEVYRRLMQSLIAQDRHAEARQTYRRCEEALSRSLGMAPSPSTQELYTRLLNS
jgi:LuxR family transcriptional regulator, maltose regulon positive regulatory protein